MMRTRADVVVIGAGFSGIYASHILFQQGMTVCGFEAAPDVGGTWYWNRYPGARCDVLSMEYAFTFSEEIFQEWTWTERYPAQPEILRYLNFAADKLDVRRHFTFGTRVTSAAYDETHDTWTVVADNGDEVTARYLITAMGCLSSASTPDFPGLTDYTGQTFHTADWPAEGVDFRGKRVGVIGTGSSGVQIIPTIAPEAESLTVFQRTPVFSLAAGNRPLTESERAEFKAGIDQFKVRSKASPGGQFTDTLEVSALEHTEQERLAVYEERWQRHRAIDLLGCYPDLLTDREANRTIADFFRAKIHAAVDDPEVAERLTPRDYPIGARRIAMDTNYFETFNRSNVDLVNLRDTPLTTFTADGIRCGDNLHELDAVVFATGFDAVTGPLLNIDIRGVGGVRLTDVWQDGAVTYLGIAVPGFPNMFTLTGPGSPNVLTNVVCAIEQHVEWTAEAIAHLQSHGISRFEALDSAAREWTQLTADLAEGTLYPEGNSWYIGANIPGKPRAILSYVGGLNTYRQRCDEVAMNGYSGFKLE